MAQAEVSVGGACDKACVRCLNGQMDSRFRGNDNLRYVTVT